MSDIVVVGAGLIGAAVAYHAASAGAFVTVVDAGRPGGGTSSTTFSWLNANHKTPRAYFDLNRMGMREHIAFRDAVGDAPWLHRGGNLEWADDVQGRAELRERVERLRSWGYVVEWLSPQDVNRDLEPDLRFDRNAVEEVAYFPEECWLDPLPLIHALLETAKRHRARVRSGRVRGMIVESGRARGVVTEDGEEIAADAIVLCVGRFSGDLLATAGFTLPMANTAGLLAITAAAPTSLRRVVHAPGVNMRPDGGGRLLLHSDETDGWIDAGTVPTIELAGCQELLRRAQAIVPAMAGVPLEAARVGIRPIPGDGQSAAGPVPGIAGAYLTTTHSGATLCLALGRLVAGEVTGGQPAPELEPFRPSRFLDVRP